MPRGRSPTVRRGIHAAAEAYLEEEEIEEGFSIKMPKVQEKESNEEEKGSSLTKLDFSQL